AACSRWPGHRKAGPQGSVAVGGCEGLLERMRPFLDGGDMISRVAITKTEWNELPWKFEAGTSSYVDAIGLGAAIDYLCAVGLRAIHDHELMLVAQLLSRLEAIPGVTVYGPRTVED